MYKIGEFSKITNMTIKTLRYYDEEKILVPSCRGDNNYRLYSEEDFKRAELILFLRSFDFSIAEVKEVLAGYEEKNDLKCYLSEKREMIHKNIEKERKVMKSIDEYINSSGEREEKLLKYNIEVKNIDIIKYISIRYKGKYSDVGKYIGRLFKAAKSKVQGPAFNLYYDDEYKEEADIELCLPVKGEINLGEFMVKELPKVKALCLTHIGAYENINLAYKEVVDYAKKNKIELLVPSREIYIKGPGMIFKGNKNKYVTEIVIPIKGGEQNE